MRRVKIVGTLNTFRSVFLVKAERFALQCLCAVDSIKVFFILLYSCLVLVAVGMCGCSGSAIKPHVGAITVTNVNGVAQTALQSMKVGSGTYLDVELSNDKNLLGIDWSVSCGSALASGTPLPSGQSIDTSCGYFTPAHTASAPVPSYASSAEGIVTYYTAPSSPPKAGTVTLYASSTSDHSRFSALTLIIAGEPISVAIVASTAPPFTLATKAMMSFIGTVSNDSTVGGGSLRWSVTCSASDCGTLSETKTTSGSSTSYTAPDTVPSGSTVTVTATSVTDSTESTSVVVTIT